MTGTFRRGVATSLLVIALAVSASGCRTEYRGHDSGIDGVLWRQIAAFEDPLWRELHGSRAAGPAAYLDALDGARWSGAAASAADLDLRSGGIVLYDWSSTESIAELSVFIASGSRAEVPRDDGLNYVGPSSVYTCYGVRADFGLERTVQRTEFETCPAALVERLAGDAAFASGEVFDG